MNALLTGITKRAGRRRAPAENVLRRVPLRAPTEDDNARKQAFLDAVEVSDSTWDEWQATAFDAAVLR